MRWRPCPPPNRSGRRSGLENRSALLRRCADVMEKGRFDTIACMVYESKKAVWEADGEVSEAIDFARYNAIFVRRPRCA